MRQPQAAAMRISFALLVIYLVLNAALSGWLFYARFTEANANRAANARIWRAVVCDIERQILADNHNPAPTLQAKRDYIAFYDHLLVVDAHAAPCGLTVGRNP